MPNTKTPYLVTGDDAELPVVLYKNNATFNIQLTATVKASLVTVDHKTVLIPEVGVLSSFTGSDWANSKVIVKFDMNQTGAIPYGGMALLEIQVDDDGKLTFFADVEIVLGNIA